MNEILSGNTILLAYPLPTRDSAVRLTPLSIMFPAAMFQARGVKTKLWDERYDSLDELDEWLMKSSDFGVSSFTGYQAGQAARLLKRAKKVNPSITTHLGGYHARMCPEQCAREPYIDQLWLDRSYGETLFPHDEDAMTQWRRGDFQYFTSRGCPFACSFCALRSAWEPKPIEALDRELKTLHDEVGFTYASFSDPNIGMDTYKDDEGKMAKLNRVERLRAIGKIMTDIGVKWDSNIRAPYLTPEMVEVLANGNCDSIEIGAESGSERMLRQVIVKGHGVNAIKTAAMNIAGSGISIMYSWIYGMPRETREDAMMTCDLIDWICSVDGMARHSMYAYSPYPGSPAYEDAVKGVEGYPAFKPPQTMEEWGRLKLMISPAYFVVGLTHRLDSSAANFKGEDWKLISPYIDLARSRWRDRNLDEFPVEEVERLIQAQVMKGNAKVAETFAMAGA